MATPSKDKPKLADDHDVGVDSDERPFLDHIIELRERLLKSLLAVLLLFFPLYYFANEIYEWVAEPLMSNLPAGSTMIATEVASPFLTPFKLSMYAAFFLAMPVILHQTWAFVSPGLYMREKRFAAPLLVSSVLLYYLGMAFAYYLVFPLVFKFFAGITPVGVAMMTDINKYLEFVMGMFFAFGFTFEIPDRDVSDRVDWIDHHEESHRQAVLCDRRLLRRRYDSDSGTRRDFAVHARRADVVAVRAGCDFRPDGGASRSQGRRRHRVVPADSVAQQKRDRSVVDQGDLHVRAKTAGRNSTESLADTVDKHLVQNTCLLRGRRRIEARTSASARIGRQGELRNHQDFTRDVDDTAVHRLRFVRKNPDVRRSVRELFRDHRRVFRENADEHQQPGTNRRNDRVVDGDTRLPDALQQRVQFAPRLVTKPALRVCADSPSDTVCVCEWTAGSLRPVRHR